jgi:prepilin-type N-terminal cleavage/methylation domain-containing protein
MIRLRLFRGQRGYTFVELMVSIVIIGLAAAIAIPYFAKIANRQKLVSAAHEIQASLLAARMRAVRANQKTSLVLTAASGTDVNHHLDTVVPDNSPAPTPTPVIYGLLPANAFAFVATPTNSKVTFSSEGRMISETVPTPSIIIVQGPVGAPIMNQVTIRTLSSGKVQVVTPTVWQ